MKSWSFLINLVKRIVVYALLRCATLLNAFRLKIRFDCSAKPIARKAEQLYQRGTYSTSIVAILPELCHANPTRCCIP